MQKLLEDATQRFSKEETLVTLTNDGKLVGYAWISKPGAKYRNHGLEHSSGNSEVVFDCIEVENKLPRTDIFKSLLNAMMAHAISIKSTTAYMYIPKNISADSYQIIKQLGFQALEK